MQAREPGRQELDQKLSQSHSIIPCPGAAWAWIKNNLTAPTHTASHVRVFNLYLFFMQLLISANILLTVPLAQILFNFAFAQEPVQIHMRMSNFAFEL